MVMQFADHGQVGSMNIPKVAERCAEALAKSLSLSGKLLLFEGIEVAAQQDW